ncbi:Lactaldehyde dehydrogenase [compost metagenome]
MHERIKDEFTTRLVEAMKAVKYGDPLKDTDIQMGPLINKAAQESVQQKVDRAVQEGAQIALGGKKVEGAGSFFEPTVITGATNEMEIVQEEIFGPVIPIISFSNLDEAIALANDSEFGLTSSLYTRNLNVAMKVIKRLKYGETYINRENFEAMQGFHAGWRKSGIGGADGKHGLNEYLQTHVVYLQYDQSVN